MFIGSVPPQARLIITEHLKCVDKETPIYIGCSGNFTIDKIAAAMGYDVYSNDISLYSKLIADIVLNQNTVFSLTDYDDIFREWKESIYKPLVMVMFVIKISQFEGCKNHYQDHVYNTYLELNQEFYQQTITRFEKTRPFDFKLKGFFFGDFVEHLESGRDAVSFIFAPTYRGGYEKMYRRVDEVFIYDHPNYKVFDSSSAGAFYRDLLLKQRVFIYSDIMYEECRDFVHGIINMPGQKKDIYLYSSVLKKSNVIQAQKAGFTGSIPIIKPDFIFDKNTKIEIAEVNSSVVSHYKHLYMSGRVDYSENEDLGIVFLADGLAFGFATFSKFLGTQSIDSLMMVSDFVVPSNTRHLSKLILYLLKSIEIRRVFMRRYEMDFQTIQTTV